MEQTQPHPISHNILQIVVGSVIVLLGQLLSLEKTLVDFSKNFISIT